jgi:uncharacterized protein (TIGR02466 family)
MNNILNSASNNVLIKDMTGLIDFDLIDKQFQTLNWERNKDNQISIEKNLFDIPGLEHTKQHLADECSAFLRYGQHLTNEFESLKVTNSWGNITKQGEEHHEHTHPFSVVSGVLFLDDHPDNLNLALEVCCPTIPYFFYTKDLYVTMDSLVGGIPVGNLKNHLIAFLSNTKHKVMDNRNSVDRRTVSFNTFWQGTTGIPGVEIAQMTF